MKDHETIAFIQKEKNKPFSWGVNDCHTLVLKYLDTVWDKDVHKEVFKKYKTKKQAIKYRRDYPESLTDGIIKAGATKLPPKMARMGDLLIKDHKLFQLAHICLGSQIVSVFEGGSTTIFKVVDFTLFDWALRIE
tara:strand:+ start:80 stop:484 length:405 start_codon:yes stop_codon:yes gene_type:complete